MLLFMVMISKATDVTGKYEFNNYTQTNDLTLSYDSLHVAFPSRIYMHYVDDRNLEKIDIKANDPIINNMIEYKILNNTLYVYMKSFDNINDDINPNDITISLYNSNDVIIKTNRNLEIEYKNTSKSTSYGSRN